MKNEELKTCAERSRSMKNWCLFLIIPLLISCGDKNTQKENSGESKDDFVEYEAVDMVNVFIGTGGHGHTYPGATMPFGMVQLSPDTRLDGWDGCGGYHYSDSVIYGFSHTHLSGTGVSDYGDVLLTPFNLDFMPAYQELMDHSKTKSSFDKVTEEAHPGYYSVQLQDFNISASLTATERVGIHQYIFDNPKNRMIAINLNHRDKVLKCGFEQLNDSTIIGHRVSEAWATEQHIYFAIRFSEAFKLKYPSGQATVMDLFRVVVFEEGKEDQPVLAKVAISAVDTDGALNNLEKEAPHWDFSQYVQNARSTWEKALAKIEVKGRNEEHIINFYSALYHTMIVPNVFNDVDGRYRGMDQKIHFADHNVYTVFSLWDTFRATHPLYGLIERERTEDFIKTFLLQYQQGGRLPVWELACNETDCMIGYHSVPVILDAIRKGINVDKKLALEAAIHSAELNHLGLEAYKKKGFIAAGDEAESVSKTLEYAYDDWCIAQIARSEGPGVKNNPELYEKYIHRSQNYKNLFNPETGFMQAKMNGAFAPNFDPAEVNFNYTEANSWQYSMFVPQDIQGLIGLHGGPEKFEEKLDLLFTTEMELSGRHQVDITGLIGQYAHGNEPSHHMAYLYNYIGKPWKTQERVHQILTEQYWNGPDGLSGNEDCGQMSAWYVLSSMGIYPVTPGQREFAIGTPLFDEVKLHWENGKTWTIKAENLSDDNIYIQAVKQDGSNWKYSHITPSIGYDATTVFEMGSTPNKGWASAFNETPHSGIFVDDLTLPVPFSSNSSQTFEESTEIELKTVCKDCKIMVSVNGADYQEYSEPLKIEETTELQYYSSKKDKKSKIATSRYQKIKGGRSVIYKTEYSNQYNAGGDKALVDYLKGSPNFRTGYWQGFQGEDVTIIVDLGEQFEPYKTVSVGFLQDIKSWIWYPDYIEISIGSQPDGHFKQCGKVANRFPKDSYGAFTQELTKTFPIPMRSRYIKITMKYAGDVPSWHLGAGGKAWVFVDEVTVE